MTFSGANPFNCQGSSEVKKLERSGTDFILECRFFLQFLSLRTGLSDEYVILITVKY